MLMVFFQTKFSHLDIAGRPTVVVEKVNVVPEHNQYFQVFLLQPSSIVIGCLNVHLKLIDYYVILNNQYQIMSSDRKYCRR